MTASLQDIQIFKKYDEKLKITRVLDPNFLVEKLDDDDPLRSGIWYHFTFSTAKPFDVFMLQLRSDYD